MSVVDIVENVLIQEDSSVWVLKEHGAFGYSDGAESERYLQKVLGNADDLSNGSYELESHIRDWPSEYHLTAKRAQLFAGFEFDQSLKVLEVGCGCGAITRYLGETFDHVVSIEGSIIRARLARLRTNGLESVTIICAPFQDIRFSGKFDIIFCIGVYEYSASFVDGEDPYDSVLAYFADMLTPTGIVVIAIENQFGLKYFNSSREDHTGTKYEGLEGYWAHGNKVKTFGKKELEDNLSRYFSNIEMFYPYPDYKLPSCVVSNEFLASSSAGELVSQIESRDYYGETKKLWDESLVSLELSKNGMLPFFSNSFLALAGKSRIVGASFNQMGVLVSAHRANGFRTKTRIYSDPTRGLSVSKKPLSGDIEVTVGKLTLKETNSTWQDSYSLQTVLYGYCASNEMVLAEIFAPCRPWINFLMGNCENIDGKETLGGEFIDCIFSNVYVKSGKVSIIDDEWVWSERIAINVIVIRSIFTLLNELDYSKNISKHLQKRSVKKLICSISESVGVKLGNTDFSEFVRLESELQSLVIGTGMQRNLFALRWALIDRPSLKIFRDLKRVGLNVGRRIKGLISRVVRAAYKRITGSMVN